MMTKESQQLHLLMKQAKELGLIDAKWAVKCPLCYAVFPGEYQQCPRCTHSSSFPKIQIDFEI